jgi:hypothetical protein
MATLCQLLAFTMSCCSGFKTADLLAAKALLDALR